MSFLHRQDSELVQSELDTCCFSLLSLAGILAMKQLRQAKVALVERSAELSIPIRCDAPAQQCGSLRRVKRDWGWTVSKPSPRLPLVAWRYHTQVVIMIYCIWRKRILT